MMQGMLSTMRINEARMREFAGAGFSTATELADTIVRSTGISFRTAHQIVGNLALMGTKRGLEEIDSVALKILGRKLSSLGLTRDMVSEALDPLSNIKKRSIIGGPAPLEVDRMILEKTKRLFRDRGELEARLDRIAAAYKHLDEATKTGG
jgi:argininosuccinate lyase